jgi:hypothetical protein
MKVDLRDRFKEEKMLRELPANHRSVFENKLKKELHSSSSSSRISLRFLSIAATVLVLFGLGYVLTFEKPMDDRSIPQSAEVSLEDYSPELKKIENYYLTAINFELASLEVTEENKALLDDYLRRMNGLTKEYQLLSKQLRMDKIDEELINNLIDNLQMRLQLMVELKNELKKIKTANNEKATV